MMPKRCYLKNGAWYYVTPGNQWIRLGKTEAEAIAAYPAAVAYEVPVKYGPVLWNCRKNAAARKIDFSLTDDGFRELVIRAGGRCEVTGLRFNGNRHGASKRRPYVPSIDRIDSSKPYSADNVRLICACVNYALNEWGTDVLDKIVSARRKHLRQCLRSAKKPSVSAPQ